ncbi:hypothetical protein [[Eubacterium] cellulosolvens]
MSKKRIMAGYNLQTTGIVAPGEPIKAIATIPDNAQVLDMHVDPNGNFVLFCEVWSHPEGTKVNFKEMEYAIVPPMTEVPHGSWEYWTMVVAGPLAFGIFTRPAKPKILQ